MGFYNQEPDRKGINIRFIIAIVIALIAIFRYFSSSQENKVTGEKQRISLSIEDEINMGLQSAAPMAQEFGGLYPEQQIQQEVSTIGNKIVSKSDAQKSPYQYHFYVLNDNQTVNAFALPGGQVFITVALLSRLKTEDELAGVLGHEIGHVVARHSAEHMEQQNLLQGLVGAASVAGGDYSTAQMAQMIGNMINMKYGRNDELESDDLGVKYMKQAGYNPSALINVMQVLKEASGGVSVPEFQSTHPSPENRVEKIQEAIEKYKNVLPTP